MKREIHSKKIEDKAYFVFYLYLYKEIFGKSTMLIANFPNPNPNCLGVRDKVKKAQF